MTIKMGAPFTLEMKVYIEGPDGFGTMTMQLRSGVFPSEKEILATIGEALEMMPGHRLVDPDEFVSLLMHNETGEHVLYKAPEGPHYKVKELTKQAKQAWEEEKRNKPDELH